MAAEQSVVQLAVPGTVLLALGAYALREYKGYLAGKLQKAEDGLAQVKSSVETVGAEVTEFCADTKLRLTRIDDALSGYNGAGGLINRVAEQAGRIEAVAKNGHRHGSWIMDLVGRQAHFAEWATMMGEKVGVPFVALPPRTEPPE